ncbi:Nucleotidyltransferase domain-containing protein [Cruoricaptor ignavus]|uniref:Nucleotidyltransferase domain-containing protein n=1 Tax=Cruoricaptor ignavus TaxID=1118202 RepID=A0A1M5ZXZ6_9FLAO|nr:nucleotidyltransferase domain-containing protein [Cruoricaptor ignavus]SHI29121.1 Nucleotidyltransferase domain-containing protein [Cruoricaptor ignavus]
MDQAAAINLARQYKSCVQRLIEDAELIMFGSFAKGSFTDDSDIDIAIIVAEMQGDYFDIVPKLWELRGEIDSRIEPVMIEKNFDPSGFLAEVERTGIRI